MKVRVDELPDSGRAIHFHETEAWFTARMSSAEDAGEVALASPVNVDLALVPDGRHIRLSGRLQATVRVVCSRCLQNFILELDETIPLTLLLPLGEEAGEEIDLRPQDLDTTFFDGETIDVDLIVAEQIFLALPQRPLCQPDCQGLCSECGVDLNRQSCGCEKKAMGSVFDALKAVKIDNK